MIQQQPYILYQLRDDSGTLGTQRYSVHHGVQPGAARASADALRARLGAMSGCAILRQHYILPGVELMRPAAAAGPRVQRCGVLVFSTAEPDALGLVVIPGIRDELVMASGQGAGLCLDTTAPALAALVAELTSGRWCNPWGHVLLELEAAYIQVRDAVYIPDWIP